MQVDGYFFICVIVGDHGIRNLRANLRTVVEKAELPKGEKADQSLETKKEMKNSKEDISLLGISQSGKNTREIKKEKSLYLDQLELKSELDNLLARTLLHFLFQPFVSFRRIGKEFYKPVEG